jgi:two-component system, NarL family, response regulator LiaR
VAIIRVVVADAAANWRLAACSLLSNISTVKILGVATNGPEALEMVGKFRPDIILMDVILPGLTGIDAARLFRREGIETKIIIVSLTGDPHVIDAAIGEGVAGYVHKSDFASELASAIRIAVRGRTFVSSQLCYTKREITPSASSV